METQAHRENANVTRQRIEVLYISRLPENHEKLERGKKGFFLKVSEEA